MEEYMIFDIKQFLEDSKGWGAEKRKLERELESISYQPSAQNETGIRSGKISKIVENISEREIGIREKIEEINKKQKLLDYAFSVITEDESELIKKMTYSDKRKEMIVWEYGRKHGIGKDYVYRDRKIALEKMAVAIMEEYRAV